MTPTALTGKKEIVRHTGRSWQIVRKWIEHRGFPAVKVDGRWESDAQMIIEWRRKQIAEKVCQGN